VKILICRVSKGGCAWADEAVAVWLKRMSRPVTIEERLFRPEPERGSLSVRRERETEKVLSALTHGDRLVVLDERGAGCTTEAFSGWIRQSMNHSVKRMVFAVGGPFGHAQSMRDQAWKVLALSPMVLNHELARIMLVEQLYRSHNLIWGGGYHH
jgi:23S rRNA (pseudouridine1915-N3)-methyltransferase